MECDDDKTPIMESSGLNKENHDTFLPELEKNSPPSTFTIHISKITNQDNEPSVSSLLQNEVVESNNNNRNMYNSVSNRQLKTNSLVISRPVENTFQGDSPIKSYPTNSLFQIKNGFSEIFRVKSKSDKLMNKVSLQSINFSCRDDCSICLKCYQSKDFVRITQCGHKYHETCLKSWLKVKKECPICRSQFKL